MAVLNVTGTASVTNGSTTVTIASGNLVAAGVTAGIIFFENGLGGAIGTVTDNTELELALPYAGADATGLAFTISIDSAVLETATSNANRLATLLDQINPIASYTSFSNELMENVDAGEWRTGLELGSIATQAANAVTITGGAMNGVTIGGSTPAPGTFTALTSTGIDDNATGNAITISASNLVGYGTSNPRSRLEIAGSYSDGPTLGSTTGIGTAYYRASDAGYGLQFGVSASGYSWIQEGRIDTSPTAYGLILQPSGGHVGIGKTNPGARLHVSSGATNEVARLESTGSPTLAFFRSGTRELYIQNTATVNLVWGESAAPLAFGANNTERMRIDTGGDVGVGTSSPSTKLHVDGPVRCRSYTVGTLPSASSVGAGTMIYVTDEAGGATPAFSDGTNFRRASDRAIVS